MRIKKMQTSNKNFILKYFRCRDGKRTVRMLGFVRTYACAEYLEEVDPVSGPYKYLIEKDDYE